VDDHAGPAAPRPGSHRARVAEARDALAFEFVDLDREQKSAGALVRAFLSLDDSPRRRRLAADWAPLDAAIESGIHEYLSALAYVDIDQARDRGQLAAARREFDRVRELLQARRRDIERFLSAHEPELAEVTSAYAGIVDQMRQAREVVAFARSAVTEAAASGLPTAGAEEELRTAEALAESLQTALATVGYGAARTLPARVRERATRAEDLVRTLAAARDVTRRRLATIDTRLEIARGRKSDLEASMHRLRREYTYSSWRDLEGAPTRISDHLEVAVLEALKVRRLVETDDLPDWLAAAEAVARTDQALRDAEGQWRVVSERLGRLDRVRRDPETAANPVRFALRDAQRLVIGRVRPDAAAVAALDAQVERLDAARGLLTGVHPDWWAYLRELDAISSAIREVVAQARARAARSGLS